jgi:galactonate dehydratase
LDFACTNAILQESSLGIHYNKGFDLLDYMANPEVFAVEDGYIPLNTKSGLGIEINEERLREGQKIGHDWSNPIWRNKDGSLAEW